MFGQSLLLPCDHKALHLFLERVNIKCLFCPRWLSLFGGLEGSTVDPNVIRWWRGPWCNKWVLKRSNLGYVGLIGLLWGTLAGPRQNRRPTRVVNGLVSHRSAHKGPYTNPVTIRVVIGLLLGPAAIRYRRHVSGHLPSTSQPVFPLSWTGHMGLDFTRVWYTGWFRAT